MRPQSAGVARAVYQPFDAISSYPGGRQRPLSAYGTMAYTGADDGRPLLTERASPLTAYTVFSLPAANAPPPPPEG
jgi:hypothetical protein